MDRVNSLNDVIKGYNKYIFNDIKDFELIKMLLVYLSKNSKLITKKEYPILRRIINDIGIPQYLDFIEVKSDYEENFSRDYLLTLINESSFHYYGDKKYHKKQQEILSLYNDGVNRYFLTAPTAFGKTFIVYEIIRKMNYRNVCMILPTIALMSENIVKISTDETLGFIRDNYSIHTLSKTDISESKNLFVYTPERYLSFRDNYDIEFDFVFIDEAYKLDNSFIIQEEQAENERDIAYRLCINDVCDKSRDILFAGPYIEFFDSSDSRSLSFTNFLYANGIELLDYNEYELVIQDDILIKTAKKFTLDGQDYEFSNTKKRTRFIELINIIMNLSENVMVYCSTVASTESYGKLLMNQDFKLNEDCNDYNEFISHLKRSFSEEWVLVKLLKKGIAVHHGCIPKYIQKEIIHFFNLGVIKVLLCTTTITEGVNTTAKNIVVLSEKKGRKLLRKFDAKNIAGRAGRFTKHYKGRVFILQKKFMKIKNSNEIEGLAHKNYDKNSVKDEVDLTITNKDYLSLEDKNRLEGLINEADEIGVPSQILSKYQSVNYSAKFTMFKTIMNLNANEMNELRRGVMLLTAFKGERINKACLSIIIQCTSPFYKDRYLVFLHEQKVLKNVIMSYLKTGYGGMLNYNINNRGLHIDYAIRDTSKVVFRAFKYELVKLIGVFDEIYKYKVSLDQNINIEDITGFSILLNKLEYNALTELGMKAADFGVTNKILRYIESGKDFDHLDVYEVRLYNRFNDYFKQN